MKKALISSLVIVLFLLGANMAYAIDIDLTNAQFSVKAPTTVHVSNVTAAGHPGTYEADLVWDSAERVLVPTNIGRMSASVKAENAVEIDLTKAVFSVLGPETFQVRHVVANGYAGTYQADLVWLAEEMKFVPINVAAEVSKLSGRVQDDAATIAIFDINGNEVSRTQTAPDGSFAITITPTIGHMFVVLNDGQPNETILALVNNNGAGYFVLNPDNYDFGVISLDTNNGMATAGNDITTNTIGHVRIEDPAAFAGTWSFTTTVSSSNCPGINPGPGNPLTFVISNVGGSKMKALNLNSPHGETLLGAVDGPVMYLTEFTPSGIIREYLTMEYLGTISGLIEMIGAGCNVSGWVSGTRQ